MAPAATCSCSAAWETRRLAFRDAAGANDSRAFTSGLRELCWASADSLAEVVNRTWDVVWDGNLADVGKAGGCLPGLALVSYSCLVSSILGHLQEHSALAVRMFWQITMALLLTVVHCLVEENPWVVTVGQVARQFELLPNLCGWGRPCAPQARPAVAALLRRTLRVPSPLCVTQRDPRRPVVGLCGGSMGHRVLRALGPTEPTDPAAVVLCTHVSLGLLAGLERQLTSWGGAASVAVLLKVEAEEPLVGAWQRRWSQSRGLHQLTFSLVLESSHLRTGYDSIYPANLLRQVAVNASSADFVLVADPGFMPSMGLRAELAGDLGAVTRELTRMRAVMLLVAFEVHEEQPAEGGELSLAELRSKVEAGLAAAFDWLASPSSRPYAWQWVLLDSGRKPCRFRRASYSDLHHATWLAPRSALHFEPHLRGLVDGLGRSTQGWLKQPRGLRASADWLEAVGWAPLVLPGHFVWRVAGSSFRPRGGDAGAAPWGEREGTGSELLYRGLLAALPERRQGQLAGRSIAWKGRIVAEVVAARSPSDFLVTLQEGSRQGLDQGFEPSELQVLVVASTILGSLELQRLLASMPWPVHAVAVGAAGISDAMMDEIPIALTNFNADQLVLVSDAYDVVALPCDRSIVEEFRRFGKKFVLAAEMGCWRGGALQPCPSCEDRYPSNSYERTACQAGLPHLNAGGIMGTAAALASAYQWMRAAELDVGDIQGAWWAFRDAFPDDVALDHAQRIWSVVGFLDPKKFRVIGAVGPRCGIVFNEYNGEEVCILHANSDARTKILRPLMQEIASLCGRPAPSSQRIWAGLAVEPEKVMPRR